MAKWLKEYYCYGLDSYIGLSQIGSPQPIMLCDCSRSSNDKVERIDDIIWVDNIKFQNTVTSVKVIYYE